MIHYVNGDIFQSPAAALVNTINTEGIVGKGIAAHFKRKYPNNYRACENACRNHQITIGHVFVYVDDTSEDKKIIVNFPTKNLWKDKSNLDEIVMGLSDLVEVVSERNIPSIAIPPLGCGLGGLDWNDVKAAIENAFSKVPSVDVFIYEPVRTRTYTQKQHRELSEVKRTMLAILLRYMQDSQSTDISYIEAHNLLYFVELFKVPLNLKFAPYCYGVYCNNLESVLHEVSGQWVQRSRKNASSAQETIRFAPTAKVEELHVCEEYAKQVEALFHFLEGYESSLGMELLATIHWLIYHDNVPSDVLSIQDGIQNWCSKNNKNWGERKLYYFTPDLLDKAVKRINETFAEKSEGQ